MNNTLMSTPIVSINCPGLTSLILAVVAGVFLCLAGLSVNPARIMLLSLPSLLTGLGAVITGV